MTAATESTPSTHSFLLRDGLQSLIDELSGDGFTVIGPTIDQGAIIFAEIESVDDLPRGWTDQQQPGEYRLERRDDDAYFGYVVGPHSWKRYLFPPLTTVATADRTDNGWDLKTPDEPAPRYAFLGVRACEIAAIKIQDRVFTGGAYVDPIYQKRREAAFIVAVNCTTAAPTCFCTSMNTGPRCKSGFDIALTEIADGFIVEASSDAGEELLGRLPVTPAADDQLDHGERARQQAVDQIQRTLNTDGIRDLLLDNLEHPQWEDVAKRCLSCTNCTMVCPTCFCSTVSEVSDLTGDHVERQRQWDSCFNIDFSYMNGGIVRSNVRSRFRQWLTHKLASWQDQFESSGCVGCGRCITWCPVGIDLTAEVATIRNVPNRALAATSEQEGTP
ncbi:MAG: 4Fe-4S dicluster domain-containing protein [Planctomycetaceae bacterium]|jgi:sulfhydrogenase subunit beta (sulfur reductase)|nr:4Fe-4S dicluster domain-containing protein [Planctomycetaceae bacterium]